MKLRENISHNTYDKGLINIQAMKNTCKTEWGKT